MTGRHPILVVARAECRGHFRRGATWLLAALFAALLIAAGVLNHQRQAADREQQRAMQELVRAQWESQPDRHPHRVAHYGTFAFRPPGPLASLDPGLDSYSGRTLYLEAHRQNAANFSEVGELSSAFRMGVLSPAFILQLVLPLIVIVLGHRLWVGERESGRLALLLGQGASTRHLVWGKFLGLCAALVPFLALAAVASVALLIGESSSDAGPAWSRLGLLGLAVLLHSLAWAGLSLWVSVSSATSARACAVLVALWIAGGIVLPRTVASLAAARVPLPDKSTFVATVAEDVRKLGDSHDPNDPNFIGLREQTLARHGVSRVEDLPFNYAGIVMARGEELSAQTFARHFEALSEKMLAQAAFVDRAGWLSPFLSLRGLSAALAGTDLRAQLRFQREAEEFRYRFVQRLNGLHRDKVRYVGDKDQKISADHWREFGDFRFVPAPLADSLRGTGSAWLALVLWTVLPAFALSRLEPRKL